MSGVTKLRKEWLPAREAHRGLHARLLETTAKLAHGPAHGTSW
ncbi:hypothetical protein [Streptomyces alboniger]|nr:hypothetical protein [Streptomyces alboniger]